MTSAKFFAIATLSALAAAASVAYADEADGSHAALGFKGSRARAEVQAEAAKVPTTRSIEPAGSRVIAPVQSAVTRSSVQAQAADAVRLGKIGYGELGQL